MSIRVRLYAARQRRWTAITLLVASLLCAAGLALIFGCVFGWPWVAIGAAGFGAPLWHAMLASAARASTWGDRLDEEEAWLERETPGDPLAGDFH